jgi:UDPglucose 6-dehydrogenase
MIRVAVVGTGYVGLVTGACLADFGNEVRCIDVDASKIARLAQGEIPFFEPGLEELVGRNADAGRLSFDTDLAAATRWAEVIFITVGTPPKKDGSADLSAIFAAGETIAKAASGYKVVVQKSTAPVGTARRLWKELQKKAGKRATIDVASNPEFLREGSAPRS